MTPMIMLTLTPQEAVAVVNVLGQLPTSSGVFPLWEKLRGQVEPQVNPPTDEAV